MLSAMTHRIVAAHARPVHTVAIVWDDGAESVVSFAALDWLAWGDVDVSSDSRWLRGRPAEAAARP